MMKSAWPNITKIIPKRGQRELLVFNEIEELNQEGTISRDAIQIVVMLHRIPRFVRA